MLNGAEFGNQIVQGASLAQSMAKQGESGQKKQNSGPQNKPKGKGPRSDEFNKGLGDAPTEGLPTMAAGGGEAAGGAAAGAGELAELAPLALAL